MKVVYLFIKQFFSSGITSVEQTSRSIKLTIIACLILESNVVYRDVKQIGTCMEFYSNNFRSYQKD